MPARAPGSFSDGSPSRAASVGVSQGRPTGEPGGSVGRPAAEPPTRTWRDAEGYGRSVAGGVRGNARLTGSVAAVLLVLLAAEGLTVLHINSFLTLHVFIGMLLVPPVLLKMGSTVWRFARYYLGAPSYRRKGPPAPLLRLLGPALVLLTLALFGTGVALIYAPVSSQSQLLFLHKASFVLWFCVLAVHVLAHLIDTARLAPRDWYWRTRHQVAGAGLRQWAIAASLVVGLLLGILVAPHAGSWLANFYHLPSGS